MASSTSGSSSKELMLYHTRYLIYLLVSFIASLVAYRVAFILLNDVFPRLSGSRAARHAASELEGQAEDSGARNTNAISFRRVPVAVLSCFRVVFCRWAIPTGLGNSYVLGELVVTAGYFATLLSFEFINARDPTGVLNPSYWANRAGLLAVSQFTFVVALSGKNNIVSALTGISYEKLNVFHRMSARGVLVLAWVHFGGRWKLGLTGNHAIGNAMVNAGLTALITITLAVVMGTRQIRNAAYEVFLVGHILLISILLLAVHYHIKQYPYTVYLWPCYALWVSDRVLRLVRTIYIRYLSGRCSSSAAQIVVVSSDTVSVKLRISQGALSGWRPGQSAYLTIPSVSTYLMEAHPFTIASVDEPISTGAGEELELLFIVRACDGFTRRLLQKTLAEGGRLEAPAFINGPYGVPPAIHSFSKVILIAGGSGISFTLPLLLDIVRRASRPSSTLHCRVVSFVWFVRHKEHVTWIKDTLREWLNSPAGSVIVDLRIYVTSKSAEDGNAEDMIPTTNYESSDGSVEKDADGESITADSKHTAEIEYGDDKEGNASACLTRLTVANGRPKVQDLMESEIASDISEESTGVAVCGPQSLVSDVRVGLRKSSIAGPMKILRGGPLVFLHVEHFGM